jgi:hypothetical protein
LRRKNIPAGKLIEYSVKPETQRQIRDADCEHYGGIVAGFLSVTQMVTDRDCRPASNPERVGFLSTDCLRSQQA